MRRRTAAAVTASIALGLAAGGAGVAAAFSGPAQPATDSPACVRTEAPGTSAPRMPAPRSTAQTHDRAGVHPTAPDRVTARDRDRDGTCEGTPSTRDRDRDRDGTCEVTPTARHATVREQRHDSAPSAGPTRTSTPQRSARHAEPTHAQEPAHHAGVERHHGGE